MRLGVVVHGRHGREELEGVGQLRQPFEELLMRVRVAGEGGEVRVVVVGRVRGWRCGVEGGGEGGSSRTSTSTGAGAGPV